MLFMLNFLFPVVEVKVAICIRQCYIIIGVVIFQSVLFECCLQMSDSLRPFYVDLIICFRFRWTSSLFRFKSLHIKLSWWYEQYASRPIALFKLFITLFQKLPSVCALYCAPRCRPTHLSMWLPWSKSMFWVGFQVLVCHHPLWQWIGVGSIKSYLWNLHRIIRRLCRVT